MTVHWIRNHTTGPNLFAGSVLMASVPTGAILRRVNYGWSFRAMTSTLYSASNILDTLVAVAVITGYPASSYTVPNALNATANVAPPLERYLRWEVRALEPITWGSADDDVATWRDSGPVEPTVIEAPVTNTAPGGAALGVFMSWAPTRQDFPGAGYASVSAWWSLMYTT